MSITNEQMRLLMKAMEKDPHIEKAAAQAGMCRLTASKHLKTGKMPSDMKVSHQWRTRSDPLPAFFFKDILNTPDDDPEDYTGERLSQL